MHCDEILNINEMSTNLTTFSFNIVSSNRIVVDEFQTVKKTNIKKKNKK